MNRSIKLAGLVTGVSVAAVVAGALPLRRDSEAGQRWFRRRLSRTVAPE
jgi:hypothetical protein